MRLETKRLSVIRLTAPQMGLLLTDQAGFERALGVWYAGGAGEDVTPDVLEGLLAAMAQRPAEWQWCAMWVFLQRKENAVIGSACFKGGPGDAGDVEIGYGLHGEAFREQGYASEAVRALCLWALAQPDVRTVTARTEPENLASCRVLEKCGFVPDGEADGLRCWRLTLHAPFVCPHCGGAFIKAGGSLVCAAGHAFDIARQGYVNLLPARPANLYDENKALFEARHDVYAAGFFDPVIEAVRARLPDGAVLDAGCGEGSLLRGLAREGVGPRIGLDIAKPAVRMAASADRAASWCVGDLCALPLADASVGAVVNVLTPANYGEFARVLREGGLLLKVVPGAGHLREIRALAGKAPYKENRAEAVEALAERFSLVEELAIRYAFPCGEALAQKVYAMTPLTAHEPPRVVPAGEITVDVTLLVGRKR